MKTDQEIINNSLLRIKKEPKMTREDLIEALGELEAIYPEWKVNNYTKEKKMMFLNVWERHFKNVRKDYFLLALDNIMDTSEFSPTITKIKEEIYRITSNTKC